MSDSLLFDGTDDKITFAVGGSPTWGPGMVAVIFKAGTSSTSRGIFFCGVEIYRDSDDTIKMWDGSEVHTASGISTLTDDVWYLVALTKTTGESTPRWHVYNFGTPGWQHANSNNSHPNQSPGANVLIGCNEGSTTFINANILIAGVWSSDYADAAVEALNLEDGIAEWTTSAPVEAWRLNSMSAIQSFGSTGTADESSRVGTTLDTGDVPAGTWDVGNEKTGAGVVGP